MLANEIKSWIEFAAEFLPGRDKAQCLHRWQKVLNPELVKGSWSKEVFSGLCINLSDDKPFLDYVNIDREKRLVYTN